MIALRQKKKKLPHLLLVTQTDNPAPKLILLVEPWLGQTQREQC